MNEHTFEQFIELHEEQLLISKVPQQYWRTLYEKLKNQNLDAGECFQIIVEENDDNNTQSCSVIALKDLEKSDVNNIFLVDHFWTFQLNNARKALEEVQNLKENLIALFGLEMVNSETESNFSSKPATDDEDEIKINEQLSSTSQNFNEKNNELLLKKKLSNDYMIEKILDEIWRYAYTYTIRLQNTITDETNLPVWYLPDEFGMRIGHSFEPNCRLIPFYHAFDNLAYSLLFPIREIKTKEEVTRNYIDNNLYYKNLHWRDYLMHPWLSVNKKPMSKDFIQYALKDDKYFLLDKMFDLLPDKDESDILSQSNLNNLTRQKVQNDPIRVYTSNFQLINQLNQVKVKIIDDLYSADVIWLHKHFFDFRNLAKQNPNALINQFPYESILTVKNLFAATIQQIFYPDGKAFLDKETFDLKPKWFPVTFNLSFELPEFVDYFIAREQKELDNTWIVKSWNLARGMEVYVTKNLNCIIRLAENSPKIVSKYISNPVLYYREDNENLVKFDLRYIVFLRRVEPLDVLIYKNFWIRFAVNEYSLDKLDDVLTHLTVHNYNSEAKTLDVECNKFIEKFENFYPHLSWSDIQQKINNVTKEVLKVVTGNKPPRGLASNPQSRAFYGFDFMLHWKDDCRSDVLVSFLEANFMPDCERACKFYPDFADVVFKTLFLGQDSDQIIKL